MVKLIHYLTNAIIVIVVAFMALLYVPRIVGISPYVVLSGSMEPTYHVGSLVFVNKNFDTIEVGDPITFQISSSALVTHRVIEVDQQAMLYTTKGDANNTADGSKVAYDNIVGVPMFTIPYLGYVAVFAISFNGKIILGSVVALMILLSYLADMYRKDQEKMPTQP
ncbi:MAG: signal peptidase I [Erysipelotrichaceae bacterium]|nr:signal peptidase I [Erysipelotrichaceae bacterium]MDD3808803.1 signal peptidase I [Erysipelotrichaceae bacterium]